MSLTYRNSNIPNIRYNIPALHTCEIFCYESQGIKHQQRLPRRMLGLRLGGRIRVILHPWWKKTGRRRMERMFQIGDTAFAKSTWRHRGRSTWVMEESAARLGCLGRGSLMPEVKAMTGTKSAPTHCSLSIPLGKTYRCERWDLRDARKVGKSWGERVSDSY